MRAFVSVCVRVCVCGYINFDGESLDTTKTSTQKDAVKSVNCITLTYVKLRKNSLLTCFDIKVLTIMQRLNMV